MKYYQARWDALLVGASTGLTVALAGAALVVFRQGDGGGWWAGVLLLVVVMGCALFAIRGYSVTPDAVLVHRLFWATRLPRAGLVSIQFQPEVMRGSFRLFGNGGLFSYSGFYRNKVLGVYRALVTDRRRTVVLKYGRRTVVISPVSPEEFVREFVGELNFRA